MPTLLAIDAATTSCSVALIQHAQVHERISDIPREHTQRLLPMVESLLAEHSLTLPQLDGIALTCGPGSFTGLRIGMSMAQGLAYGADLPLIPISTLDAMASGVIRRTAVSHEASIIAPVIDARMDEVYWAAYQADNGKLNQLIDEQVGSPEQCLQSLLSLSHSVIGVGSGWHYETLQSNALCVSEPDNHFCPAAHDVAILGEKYYREHCISQSQAGQHQVDKGRVMSALEVQPSYLRDEIHWKKRERIRQT